MINLESLKGQILTLTEAAELLKLKPDSLRRRIRLGHIKAFTPPGSNAQMIKGDDLAAYLMGASTPAPPRVPGSVKKPPIPPPVDPNAALPFKLSPAVNARLKAWILGQNLQLKDVAAAAKINNGELSRIVNGKRALSRTNAERLRAAYGDDLINYLLTD